MKMQFLFQIVETGTGKAYFGIHSSEDLFFANPPCNLMSVRSCEQLFEHLPHELQQYIRSQGKHHFTVTAIECGDRASLRRRRVALIKSLPSHLAFNHLPIHDVSRREELGECMRIAMMNNQNARDGRKKYSKYRKKKVKH